MPQQGGRFSNATVKPLSVNYHPFRTGHCITRPDAVWLQLWHVASAAQWRAHDQQELPMLFLTHLRESCLAQQQADGLWHVPWSRHLLACLHRITGAELLIGIRAVARHPHFQHYLSPFSGDQILGAVLIWPDVEDLLLLDSFEPNDRHALWHRVNAHTQKQQIRIFLQNAGFLSNFFFGFKV